MDILADIIEILDDDRIIIQELQTKDYILCKYISGTYDNNLKLKTVYRSPFLKQIKKYSEYKFYNA